LAEEAGERTEQPTQRRLDEAREQGRVPRSADLTASIALVAALALLRGMGGRIFDEMHGLTRALSEAPNIHPEGLWDWSQRAVAAGFAMLLPFLGLLIALTIAGGVVQSGWVLSWSKLAPQWEKLNPTAGAKRLFSGESLQKLAMSLLKFGFVAMVAYSGLAGKAAQLISATSLDAAAAFSMACSLAFDLAIRIAVALLILGLLDYFYQRWTLQRSLKMTKQEVREELKRMEGDPLMKHRRRQIHMKLAMQRIALDVPKADVIVTNPTHYSVALRYDESTMTAPRVLVKGKDLLALRIRQIAAEHGIPVVERPPLARALYAGVESGREVPPTLYKAVAEVLAYVYELNRLAGRRARTA
jgi:flagellar biosynthesis protein FlhB